MAEEYRTIRLADRFVRIPDDKPIVIDPPSAVPAKYGPGRFRWALNPEAVGIVERICRARFEVQRLVRDVPDHWPEVEVQAQQLTPNGKPIDLTSPDQVIDTIAQSVYASSKIEGEEVYAKDVPVAIVGQGDIRQGDHDDYALRIKGAQESYKAYIWALSRPTPLAGGGVISPAFVLELHGRLFGTTKPHSAGKLKSKPNLIQIGEKVVMRMLPPNRVEEFLDRLCDRLNAQFQVSDNSGRYNKLMAVGEFVLDFLAMHPFDDGNGRTARLLSTYLLEKAGFYFARFYSLDSVILDRHAEYYQVLMDSQREWYTEKEDITPWVAFYLSCIFAQWLRAHEEILRHQAIVRS